jgi:hypothetical protein
MEMITNSLKDIQIIKEIETTIKMQMLPDKIMRMDKPLLNKQLLTKLLQTKQLLDKLIQLQIMLTNSPKQALESIILKEFQICHSQIISKDIMIKKVLALPLFLRITQQ